VDDFLTNLLRARSVAPVLKPSAFVNWNTAAITLRRSLRRQFPCAQNIPASSHGSLSLAIPSIIYIPLNFAIMIVVPTFVQVDSSGRRLYRCPGRSPSVGCGNVVALSRNPSKTGDYVGFHFIHVCALFYCHGSLILIPTCSAQSVIFITVSSSSQKTFSLLVPILMPMFQLVILPNHRNVNNSFVPRMHIARVIGIAADFVASFWEDVQQKIITLFLCQSPSKKKHSISNLPHPRQPHFFPPSCPSLTPCQV
jgi:energy-coupling factor transporter transmembrane protein EcfT